MNLSESAKMTTAHEASFRVPYPNSKPRAIKVIALDPISASLVNEVSRLPWHGAAFFTSLSFTGATTRRAGRMARPCRPGSGISPAARWIW